MIQEELIEEVDWDGKTVAVRPKSDLKKEMFPHKVALIIPKQDGKLLLCRRAKDKHPFPDTWCCAVGGKVIAGESYVAAAAREMQEEVGVSVPVKQVATFKYNKEDYKGIFAVFTTDSFPINSLQLDPSEIQFIKGFASEELRRLIIEKPHEFAPTFQVAVDEFTRATL